MPPDKDPTIRSIKGTVSAQRLAPPAFPQQLLRCGQYEPACQACEFLILSPRRTNWPPQFEHSALDFFEGEAKLGDPTVQYFALLYTGHGQPTGFVRASDCRTKEECRELTLGSPNRNSLSSACRVPDFDHRLECLCHRQGTRD
jgi:hypothetical protein